jgi:hypothetical protein
VPVSKSTKGDMTTRFYKIRPRADDDYFEALTLVRSVAEAYAETFEISDTAVFGMDDDAPPQKVIRPGSPACHFRIDVERITGRILKDAPDLQAAWFALAQGGKIATKDEHTLVRRLGKAYIPLHPGKYFRPPKHRGSVLTAERLRRIAA